MGPTMTRAQSEIRIGIGKPLKTKKSEVTIRKPKTKENNFMRPPTGKTVHTIIAKEYFRDPSVNDGFYSKKREGVADVDPKVSKSLII